MPDRARTHTAGNGCFVASSASSAPRTGGPCDPLHRLAHLERPIFDVDLLPAQGLRLAAAQIDADRHRQQCVPPVVLDRFRKLGGFLDVPRINGPVCEIPTCTNFVTLRGRMSFRTGCPSALRMTPSRRAVAGGVTPLGPPGSGETVGGVPVVRGRTVGMAVAPSWPNACLTPIGSFDDAGDPRASACLVASSIRWLARVLRAVQLTSGPRR
jgi:hypothetical protein